MQRNNDGVNFVYTNRYNLSDKSLQRVTEFIKETYGLDVERIDENERGYVFMMFILLNIVLLIII